MTVLLAHEVLSTYWGVAVAAGTTVCSATGSKTMTNADGEPLPATAHHADPCCCTQVVAPLPFLGECKPVRHRSQAPHEPLTLQKLAAQWLAPLSRGPPVFS